MPSSIADLCIQERKELTPPLCIYPEGDMLQALKISEGSCKRRQDWGRGWADPEIRKLRLAEKGAKRPRHTMHKRGPRKYKKKVCC
eukprot:c28820_g1_i1 orf=230-487(-)